MATNTYRPTPVAAAVQAASERALTAAARVTDPITRAQHLHEATEQARVMLAALAEARTAALREARQTMSVVELAAKLGVTRARVYQLLDD